MKYGAGQQAACGGNMKIDTRFWTLRRASAFDLPAVNGVIESAIETWDIPDRVKRLCMPLYRYSAHDLDFLDVVVVEAEGIGIVGVAAWDQADPGDAPVGHRALLLHGIYVAPAQHRKGIGTRLFEAAAEAAAQEDVEPGSDLHASADYRRHLVKVLAGRTLTEAFERAKGG